MVPTFTSCSIGQAGTQLYPGSIATPTPQTFGVASPPFNTHGTGVGFHAKRKPRTASRPISARFEPVLRLRDVNHWFALAYPLALLAGPAPSGSTGASRHCRSCFPPSPALPGSGCSQLQPSRCDGQAAEVFHLPSNIKRLVAHVLVVEGSRAWAGCVIAPRAHWSTAS